MLLGNGTLLPEEKFKDFQKPAETLPRSPGHWVEWVNYAKGLGPVPGSNLQPAGRRKRIISATSPTAPARRSSGTTRTCAPQRAGSGAVHQAA